MQVKRYEAPKMKEVLKRVRDEMGEDAVIISTRKFKKRGPGYGFAGQSMVEVTAASDTDFRQSKKPQKISRSYVQVPPISKSDIFTQSKRDSSLSEISSLLSPLKSDLGEIKNSVNISKSGNDYQALKSELLELKSMMSYIVKTSQQKGADNLEEAYKPYYASLLSSGLKEEYALEALLTIQNKISQKNYKGSLHLEELIPLCLNKLIVGRVKIDGILDDIKGEKNIAVFVGPTGVGKTTTIAKLAAGLVFEGKKVGLITVDTYRIAATEQLKIYANIIGAPVSIVEGLEELGLALETHKDKDIVLIDTAGRSHNDLDQLRELTHFFSDTRITKHLVLSAGTDQRNLEMVVKSFSSVLPIDNILFTKLDEAFGYGVLYNISVGNDIPISYLTIGQKVPEDIAEATPDKIAYLITSSDKATMTQINSKVTSQ